jgi:hypothetical protein
MNAAPSKLPSNAAPAGHGVLATASPAARSATTCDALATLRYYKPGSGNGNGNGNNGNGIGNGNGWGLFRVTGGSSSSYQCYVALQSGYSVGLDMGAPSGPNAWQGTLQYLLSGSLSSFMSAFGGGSGCDDSSDDDSNSGDSFRWSNSSPSAMYVPACLGDSFWWGW